MVMQVCREREPLLRRVTDDRFVACHLDDPELGAAAAS
jgi:hypothetical protein